MSCNVLHLLGTAAAEGSSIARTVAQLAVFIDPARYRMHAWFLGGDGPLVGVLRDAGITVDRVDWNAGIRDPAGMHRFWRLLGRETFAIVHQHFGGRSVRWAVRRAQDARIVVHRHGRIDEARQALPSPARIEGADSVIAVSNAVARQLRGARVEIVYPGVLPFPPSWPTSTSSTNRGRPIVIGTACRLVPVKGLNRLLQSVATLLKGRGEIRLEIAGSGPLRGELERLAVELGIASSVTFLGWRQDIGRAMSGWDVYVQTSLDEGIGVSVLEAMAAGLPVVATDVGGTSELVVHGETGLLVPASNPGRLAEVLEALLRDEPARQRMGEAGRRRAYERFGAKQMAERISALYSTLLARPNRAGRE